jgi:MtaA/CmuA family methyltransferase
MSMNSAERVLKALQGATTDRPPFICPGGMMSMITIQAMQAMDADWPRCHTDAKEMSRLAQGVQELTGIENLGVPYCMTVEAEAMGAKVAMGRPESEPRVAEYPLQRLSEFPSLSRLRPGSGRLGAVTESIARLMARTPPFAVIANLTGPVSLATSLIEPMTFYKALGKTPDQAHEFMQFLTENLISFGRWMLQAGARILTISDPSASGEILGPRRFAQFALPYINRILDALQNDYAASLVHICGNLKPVLPLLSRLHTRAISIDSATSIPALLRALGTNQVVVGSVSTHLLLNGTPQTVERASRICLKRGVRILSPACGISPFTPLSNMRAMAVSVRTVNQNEPETEIGLHGKRQLQPRSIK